MSATFDNLPPLTPDQTNVVIAMLAGQGPLAAIATNAGFTLGRFLDLLESPEVQAHLAAARRAATTRAHQRLAEAAHPAAEILEAIALDESHDRVERRRAATTILRTLRPTTRRQPASRPDQFEILTRARDLDPQQPAPELHDPDPAESPPDAARRAVVDSSHVDEPRRTRTTNQTIRISPIRSMTNARHERAPPRAV